MESGPTLALEADVVRPDVAARVWSLNSETAREQHHLLVLTSGTGTLDRDTGERIALAGASAALLPPGSCTRLAIDAGAAACLLKLNAALWPRHVLPSAEEVSLEMARLRAPLVRAIDPELAASLARSITAVAAELMAPARHAALSIISAELSLALLRLWRQVASADEHAHDTSAAILGRFRRLVEEHFAHHLRVADFASQLGISSDRLHAICTRTLGRTPSALIQQRLMQDAVLRLERSATPVKQIAFALGFRDTAYFSRFFAKHTGVSPRAWRLKAADRARAKHPAPPSLQFADWP